MRIDLINGLPESTIIHRHGLHVPEAMDGQRSYKLAWNDRSALTVIATDGGLLAAPLQRDCVMLAPAERVDLWVDFGRWPSGSELTLQSLALAGDMAMGGMMMGRPALPDGSAFPVLTLRIAGGARSSAALPRRLSSLPRPDSSAAVNADRPKVFTLTMGMMTWGVNGRSFEMERASSPRSLTPACATTPSLSVIGVPT